MLSRRALLRSALTLAMTAFCSAHAQLRSGTGVRNLHPQTDPFALGVASGDPTPSGAILWTRASGLEAPAIELGYEVAEDAAFRRIVRQERVTALASFGHAVHVPVTRLRPGAMYWYRFHHGDAVSRVGRFSTVALAPRRLRIALASCQHWEQGFFSAYADMIGQEADIVLHVGDYIYESSFGAGERVRSFGASMPQTLQEYRSRYALYRSDAALQSAHAALPFVMTWDDHEVENDYAGDASALGTSDFIDRRAAAYQAWLEHAPVDPHAVRIGATESRIFRRLLWPGLATIHVLDTRQYRDIQPCSPRGRRRGHAIAPCDDVSVESRSMLGTEQERWFLDGLGKDDSIWNVVAQQTLFSPMRLPGNTIWSDFWDAYPAARARVIAALRARKVRNPLILGGDLHSFWVNDVHEQPADTRTPIVATELLTTCLAGHNAPDDLLGAVPALNDHVRFLDNRHSGYQLLELTAGSVQAQLRVVDRPMTPDSVLHTLRAFHIRSGEPGARAL